MRVNIPNNRILTVSIASIMLLLLLAVYVYNVSFIQLVYAATDTDANKQFYEKTSTQLLQQCDPNIQICLTAPPPTSTNFSSYTDSTFPVRIQYPSNWEKVENYRGSIISFGSPINITKDSKPLQAILSIGVQFLPSSNISLSEYTGTSLDQIMKSNLTDFNLIELNLTTLADSLAHKIVYTIEDAGIQSKIMQVYTIKGDKAYIVSYRAEEDQYPDYLETGQRMIDSFEIGSVEFKFQSDGSNKLEKGIGNSTAVVNDNIFLFDLNYESAGTIKMMPFTMDVVPHYQFVYDTDEFGDPIGGTFEDPFAIVQLPPVHIYTGCGSPNIIDADPCPSGGGIPIGPVPVPHGESPSGGLPSTDPMYCGFGCQIINYENLICERRSAAAGGGHCARIDDKVLREKPLASPRLHSSKIWSSSTSERFEGGQIMEFRLKNLNAIGTTITITDTKWGVSQRTVLLPLGTATLTFSAFGSEPMEWRFDIRTESDVALVTAELYSSWIPGDRPNR